MFTYICLCAAALNVYYICDDEWFDDALCDDALCDDALCDDALCDDAWCDDAWCAVSVLYYFLRR